jgi:transcriptional regulator with XRE-family HTH domain
MTAGAVTASYRMSRAVLVPRLRQLRNWAALSQDDLAELAKVSRVTIARGERGLPIRASSVRKLARALRVSPRELQQPPSE